MAFRIPPLDEVLAYKTVKIVEIKNWKLGFIHYLIQLKGYQESGPVIGASNSKLKGSSYYLDNNSVPVVWDIYDVVYPAQELNAFYITTRVWETNHQNQSVCVDYYAGCNATTPCAPYLATTDDGVSTGNCSTENYCIIYGWCPVEQAVEVGNRSAITTDHLLTGIETFTLFLKVQVQFPNWDVNADNIASQHITPGLNFFNISTILQEAKISYQTVQQTGALIVIKVNWECDLDKSISKCQPQFSFQRIDDPNNSLSVGYNFRYTTYYWVQDGTTGEWTQYRDLLKVYGLRFVILIAGEGRKFSIVPLLVNIGSGLALLGIATIISDLIAIYLVPNHRIYKENKFQEVESVINNNNNEKSPLLTNNNKY